MSKLDCKNELAKLFRDFGSGNLKFIFDNVLSLNYSFDTKIGELVDRLIKWCIRRGVSQFFSMMEETMMRRIVSESLEEKKGFKSKDELEKFLKNIVDDRGLYDILSKLSINTLMKLIPILEFDTDSQSVEHIAQDCHDEILSNGVREMLEKITLKDIKWRICKTLKIRVNDLSSDPKVAQEDIVDRILNIPFRGILSEEELRGVYGYDEEQSMDVDSDNEIRKRRVKRDMSSSSSDSSSESEDERRRRRKRKKKKKKRRREKREREKRRKEKRERKKKKKKKREKKDKKKMKEKNEKKMKEDKEEKLKRRREKLKKVKEKKESRDEANERIRRERPPIDECDYDDMYQNYWAGELKDFCKGKGLKCSGKKAALIRIILKNRDNPTYGIAQKRGGKRKREDEKTKEEPPEKKQKTE